MLLKMSVTRMTMAGAIVTALAVGAFVAVDGAQAQQPPAVGGNVTNVGADSITIQPSTGNPITVKVNDSTAIKVGGQAAKLADIKVGMRAYVTGERLSTGNPAATIYAYTPKPPATQPSPSPTPAPGQPALGGTITAVGSDSVTIQPSSGSAVAVKVNDATVIKVAGKVAKLADLKVGMRAYATGTGLSTGNPATLISAYAPSTQPSASPTPSPTSKPAVVAGTVTAVAADSITLQPTSGQPVTIKVNDATVIKVAGSPAKIGDVKVGMRAYATGERLSTGQPATAVSAYMPANQK